MKIISSLIALVNYDLPVCGVIRDTNFTWTSWPEDRWLKEKFSSIYSLNTGIKRTEIKIVDFGGNDNTMSPQEIFHELDNNNLRPADLYELLSVAQDIEYVGDEMYVFALGTKLNDNDYPTVYIFKPEARALNSFDGKSGKSKYFAVVSK